MDIAVKETKKLSVGNNGIYVHDVNVDKELVKILVDRTISDNEDMTCITVDKSDLVGIVEVINTYLEEDKKIR